MNDNIKQFLTPILRDATEEQLKLIGYAAFGSNYNYVQAQQATLLNEYKETLSLDKFSDEDREKLKYIIDNVETFDENPELSINDGLVINRNKLDEKPSAKSIIKHFSSI